MLLRVRQIRNAHLRHVGQHICGSAVNFDVAERCREVCRGRQCQTVDRDAVRRAEQHDAPDAARGRAMRA